MSYPPISRCPTCYPPPPTPTPLKARCCLSITIAYLQKSARSSYWRLMVCTDEKECFFSERRLRSNNWCLTTKAAGSLSPDQRHMRKRLSVPEPGSQTALCVCSSPCYKREATAWEGGEKVK
jgi:hypothetical protein